jgi:CRP/FNR family transcriptional regulator, anaerobic regulatory protein
MIRGSGHPPAPEEERPCLGIVRVSDPALREAIAQLCTLERFRGGDTVQHEEQASRFVGFVHEGVLRLVKYRPDGHQHIIGLLHKDAMFGRLFGRMPPLTIEAATDAVVCIFERQAFEALLLRFPELEHRILEAVCDELDAAHEGMLLLSSPLRQERLATFLLQLLRHASADGQKGGAASRVALPVIRSDIAHYLGTSPETISRIFARLARMKVLRLVDRWTVEVLDLARLVEVSGWDRSDWADLWPHEGDRGETRPAPAQALRASGWGRTRPPRAASGDA